MSNCDYCSKTSVNLEEYEAGEGTIRRLDITFIPKLRHIQVKILDNNKLSMCFGLNERLNYCPMCGGELNKNII